VRQLRRAVEEYAASVVPVEVRVIEPRASVYEPTKPDPTSPGSYVISDPSELQKYLSKQPIANSHERRFDSGWSWRKVLDTTTGKHQWHIHDPSGAHAAIKRSEEAATRLCENEGDHSA